MNTPQQDPLARALARQADQFSRRGGAELDLGQVLDRAGQIRRGRRMRATMLMAACVLAIVAPIGIVSLDRDASRQEPTPARRVEDRTPLTLTGLSQAAAPRIGYAQDGVLHLEGFAYAAKGERFVALAAIRDGVLVATSDDQGNLRARLLDSSQSWPMEGGFAVSPDRNVAAFTQPDGTVTAVQDGGSRFFDVGKVPAGTGFDTVAVSGENCSGRSEADGCAVYVSSKGTTPATWVARTHRSTSRLQPPNGLGLYLSAAGQDRLAWVTSVTDAGSCSQVDEGGRSLWRTCDHRILSFSPDGRRVLASAAYADGLGDTQLAVLDAATGKVGLDLSVADGGAITQMVWEDDTHLLAVVYDANRWGVVRIGLDGRRELAVAPAPDSGDLASPFVLATR
jgi:hypothetical protein